MHFVNQTHKCFVNVCHKIPAVYKIYFVTVTKSIFQCWSWIFDPSLHADAWRHAPDQSPTSLHDCSTVLCFNSPLSFSLSHVYRRSLVWMFGARIWRGTRAYNGGLEQSPQWGPGAKPVVRGSGGEAPWSWRQFCYRTSSLILAVGCSVFELFRLKQECTVLIGFNLFPLLNCNERTKKN